MRERVGSEVAVDVPPWANLTRRQQVISGVAFAVAYVATAALAKRFAVPNGIAAWYPPAAVMFAYLLVAGPRFAPVAIAVRVVSDLINFPDVVERDGIVTVVAGATVVAAVYAWGGWVLRRHRLDHARVRQFGWFAVIGVMACPLLAAAGFALVQVVFADAARDVALDQALTFWVGDAVAIASIVPFILLAAYTARHGSSPVRLPTGLSERIEIFAQAIAVVVVPVGIFAVRESSRIVPFLFLAMIPVIWVALRQNLLVASFGILVTNTVVAIGAVERLGPTDDFVAVQTLMLAAALAALYAGAVRRTENLALVESIDLENRYRTLVEHSPALVARFDRDGNLLLQAGRLHPSASPDLVVGALAGRWDEIVARTDPDRIADLEWSLGEGEDARWFETRAVVEASVDGTVASVLTVTSDRTAVRRAAAAVARAARRDPLTGLANRAAIEEVLARRPPELDPVHRSVIAVELDDAETVTAGLSSAAADQLAVTVAERLGPVIARGDLLARTGRTSFAIVTSRAGEASRLASAAVHGVGGPVALEGESAHLQASAGISDGEGDASARLEHAELAAKVAQDAGGGRAAHFHPSMVATATDLRRTVHGLRQALRAAELRVHYQPIVSLPEQRVLGVEALVRWERPGHGLVGPADFIEIAERSGLIDDLGAAVEQLARNDLIGDGLAPPGPFALNLNVSAPQLTTGSFRSRIRDVIDAFATAGIDLHLELTETAILEDPAEACKVLEELRAHGAKVVLDDFGTGFSAISWLHQLPVDAIKLDRSFVMGLPDDEPSVRIAGLVTALAGELDLALTAEGVETEAQLESLAALGCTQAQGFLFARPMPHHELIEWLATHPGGVPPRP